MDRNNIPIESLKPNYLKVYWPNTFNCGKEVIDAPITKDEKCVGVITGVNEKYVYGFLFERIIAEFRMDDFKVCSFEIVNI